jgi:hypothetical protein
MSDDEDLILGNVATRRAVLASVPLSLFSAAAEANDSQFSTMGYPNGRYWKLLDRERGLGYLVGLENGLTWLASFFADDKLISERISSTIKANFPLQMTRGEAYDAISSFYTDPTNVRIPIVLLLPIVTLKQQGMSPVRIEELLATLRKNVADR